MMHIFEAIGDLLKNVESVVYLAHIRALMTVFFFFFYLKTRLMHLYVLTPLIHTVTLLHVLALKGSSSGSTHEMYHYFLKMAF